MSCLLLQIKILDVDIIYLFLSIKFIYFYLQEKYGLMILELEQPLISCKIISKSQKLLIVNQRVNVNVELKHDFSIIISVFLNIKSKIYLVSSGISLVPSGQVISKDQS